MCWRGHSLTRSRNGYCLECHRLRATWYRTGRKPPRRPAYMLKVEEFRRLALGRHRIVAALSGVPYETMASWIYDRSGRGRSATTKDKAEVLAAALRVPFERLWVKASGYGSERQIPWRLP